MRLLLADGLGSVRQEMAGGGAVETTTTYAPYGKLLAQTGTSGTVYGFTGEQEDAATGLVYLRARYYSPYLNQFQSRDPFPGYGNLPASQNGYNYTHGNPVNYTDPTGECVFFGVDTLICGSVIIVMGMAYLATMPNPPEINLNISFSLPDPSQYFVERHPYLSLSHAAVTSLIQDPCTTVEVISEVEKLAEEYVNNLPDPEGKLKRTGIDVYPRPYEEQIFIYRGLDGKISGNIYSKPVYSPSQFRVDPDGVSTFELQYLPGNKPYAVGFGLNLNLPKSVGLTVPLKGVGLEGCAASYTPQYGQGHWSINCLGGEEDTKQLLSSYSKSVGAILNPNWVGGEERRLP